MRYYARFECADGAFIDAAGTRYDVVQVRRVRDKCGINVGYEPFPSMEDALSAWGVHYVSPA